jgi:hypothetical protein
MYIKISIPDIVCLAIIGGVTYWLDGAPGSRAFWLCLGSYAVGNLAQYIKRETKDY